MEECRACQFREETIQELICENDKLKKLLALKSAMNKTLTNRNREVQRESDHVFIAMCQGDAISQADGYVECTVPPPGWRCTRGIGHDGPCAAIPIEDDECHMIQEKAKD